MIPAPVRRITPAFAPAPGIAFAWAASPRYSRPPLPRSWPREACWISTRPSRTTCPAFRSSTATPRCASCSRAEYVCVPAASLARKPAGMTFEQAAAIPQAGMLAWQGLIDVGQIQRGQKLLLNGAGGGVGTIALQIAKLYGAEITAVDKPGKLDMLRALGANHVIDFQKEDFTESGRRYDLILDVQTGTRPLAGSWQTRAHRRVEGQQGSQSHERAVHIRKTAARDRRAVHAFRFA